MIPPSMYVWRPCAPFEPPAGSHDRPAVVQVMGRNSGDIAMKTAMATGAEMVVVPEMDWDVDVLAARLNG